MLNVHKTKETLKILSKECENELYVTRNIWTIHENKMYKGNEKVFEIWLDKMQGVNEQFWWLF